ncbi:chitinase precursor, putative [Candida dubliniensis CD36]|uniref:chitinase n=1 Tax=Candida dubliniensis (strain CD36 / ATCC MYA-646 / CBS 7987 / NCPF 3949 / NRRL Y-17841) TaxID=573826 RepID=B9WKL3_CANDC|nr:chitinase precursor, putative [Candida dubliniensis CD36]CAX39561.1 chitinase precursor, putative [Candida dubliniensis CD36]
MIPNIIILLAISIVASASNIAAYWGQNAGGNQQSLGDYCSSSPASIIILSFLDGFPNLSLNFANQCSETFSSGLAHCSQIGSDIKSCQQQGKTVLLSLGGATGNYGFSSDSEAVQFAGTLWNKFGGGKDSERPFDDAIVDGFDFDIENKDQTGYAALATQLRKYFGTGSKSYYLSAAPQCPYPDESVGDLMSQVDLDFAFIQFYNNYCSLNKQFNWNSWSNYARGKNIKLYLGLPGSSSSAGSGFVGLSTVQNAVASIKGDVNFGGISVWDISSAENSGYLNQLHQALSGSGSSVAPSNSYNPYQSYNPNTQLTTTYGGSTATASAYVSVGFTAGATHRSTTTNGLFAWIDSLFGSSPTSQSSVVQQAAATATPKPTASAFDWFGWFDGTTTSTTLQTVYSTVPADQTVYMTLTTTVGSQSLFNKRDVVAEAKSTNLQICWLLFIPLIALICS